MTAADASGNENDGALANGPMWTDGKVGNGALSFDGANDTVSIGTNASLNLTGAMTVAAWINKNSGFQASDCIVCRFAGGHNATAEHYSLHAGFSASQARFQVSNGVGVLATLTGVADIQNGTWIHLAGTYNGTDTTSLYMNGVLVDFNTAPGFGAMVSPARAAFGISPSAYFGGTIDDVRIYDRALSAAEVNELYNYASEPDTAPPEPSAGAPTGVLQTGAMSTLISLSTDENATCKFDTVPDTQYASMPDMFAETGTTSHSSIIGGLADGGSYAYFVRCQDASGNANATDYQIIFSVAQPEPDITPPMRADGGPSGILAAGTVSATLSLATDENAVCKYGMTENLAYSEMTEAFSATGGVNHSNPINGLVDGGIYTYYVRCTDIGGNTNTDDYMIAFSVAEPAEPETITVDAYVDFESGALGDDLTLELLSDATEGTGVTWAQSGPVWQPAPGPGQFVISETASKHLRVPVLVEGTLYVDDGTRGVDFDHTINNGAFYRLNFSASQDTVSIGFFLKSDLPFNWTNYDLMGMVPANGQEFCVVQWRSSQIRVHTKAGGGGPFIPVTPGAWYWVTAKWVRNDKCYVQVYSADDWTLLGTSDLVINDNPADRLWFGPGNHGAYTEAHTYLDNFIVDWSESKFPLGL